MTGLKKKGQKLKECRTGQVDIGQARSLVDDMCTARQIKAVGQVRRRLGGIK